MYKILQQSQKLKVCCFIFFAFLSHVIIAQEREISGVVLDNSGLPLPGASVLLKNTSNGVVTNFEGELNGLFLRHAGLIVAFLPRHF